MIGGVGGRLADRPAVQDEARGLALASLGVTSHEWFRFGSRFAARGTEAGSAAMAIPAARIGWACRE